MVKIGKKIREARKVKVYSQEELAKAIGVSDKSISAYESDRVSPPLKVLEKIAEQTDRSLGYFLEDSMDSGILDKLNDVQQKLDEVKQLLMNRVR